MSGLLCAPSFPFGRPFSVALRPCCLSIGEDRTHFRRMLQSCQVSPRSGRHLRSPALPSPQTLSPFWLGRRPRGRRIQHRQRFARCPCSSRNRNFPSRFAGLRSSRTRMATWGLLLSTRQMIQKSLQVPPLGKKLRPLLSQLPQLLLCLYRARPLVRRSAFCLAVPGSLTFQFFIRVLACCAWLADQRTASFDVSQLVAAFQSFRQHLYCLLMPACADVGLA